MKKTLLWIVPAVLMLSFLLGLGLYLDFAGGQKPLPEVTLPGEQDASIPPTDLTELPPESEQPTETAPTEPVQPDSTAPSATEELQTGSSTPEATEPAETAPLQPEHTEPSATESSTNPTEDADLAAKEARIDALVAEVYALRDYYTAQLLALEAAAISEYESLSQEERTPERKQQIAFACVDAAYALEDACDARMDAICQELSYLLLETGGSMSLVTDIRYTYASEKERARTAFLEKYANYFG